MILLAILAAMSMLALACCTGSMAYWCFSDRAWGLGVAAVLVCLVSLAAAPAVFVAAYTAPSLSEEVGDE